MGMNHILIVISGVFILVGIISAFFILAKIRKAYASRNWAKVPGDLVSADLRIVVYEGREPDGGADMASALVPDFKYTYTVNGKRYQGTRVTFSDGVSKFPSVLRKLQEEYKGKNQIIVYYNPENPAESVLKPGASIFNFTPLITSFLFVMAGIYLAGLDL